jgi:hypothetical protein
MRPRAEIIRDLRAAWDLVAVARETGDAATVAHFTREAQAIELELDLATLEAASC